jgi:predicted metal-binding protein
MEFQNYATGAIEMGAANAVPFITENIAFDSRVALKCIFGCASFGKNHTCPYQRSPLTMAEYEEMLRRYRGGIIIGCKDKHESQRISYEIERMAFLDGHYFAFSLSDCGLCKTCTRVHDAPCAKPERARPAFHAVGIDVFKTCADHGLPLAVARTHQDDVNWYSAVFIA